MGNAPCCRPLQRSLESRGLTNQHTSEHVPGTALGPHNDPSHRGLLHRHSLSTHLDSFHRGLLPVSHVFIDSSRLSCFLIAPPRHQCVRLLFVRAVVYLVWPSTILRLCRLLSINRSAKSLFLPPITCTATHTLHSGLCTLCLLD